MKEWEINDVYCKSKEPLFCGPEPILNCYVCRKCSKPIRPAPAKQDEQIKIPQKLSGGEGWENQASQHYGSVYTMAFGNRETINKIIDYLNRKEVSPLK